MRALLALLVSLAPSVPAHAGFDESARDAATAARAAVRQTLRGPRTVVCAIEADRAIVAENQVGRLKQEQRYPVDIRQTDPHRVEVRAEALPIGAQTPGRDFLAARIAGVMIRERDAVGYWMIGLLFTEAESGARRLHVWQVTSHIGAKDAAFDLDLAGGAPGTFETVVPSKSGEVPVKVSCEISK